MEPRELNIEEADIRELLERLVQSGVPQTVETLSEWYISIVIQRFAAE